MATVMKLVYVVATAASFFHVYRYMTHIFDHWVLAAVSAVVIDLAIIAFLWFADNQPKKSEARSLCVAMVIFFGFTAFTLNAIDAFNAGSGLMFSAETIQRMDVANLLQFAITGLLAPLAMIVSAIFVFAPGLVGGVKLTDKPKQQPPIQQRQPHAEAQGNGRQVAIPTEAERPGNFR